MWDNFGTYYQNSIIRMLRINTSKSGDNEPHTLNDLSYKKVEATFTVYHNEISYATSSAGDKTTYNKGSNLDLIYILNTLGYYVEYLQHNQTRTYDGLVLSWKNANDAISGQTAYNKETSPPVLDTSVNINIYDGSELSIESTEITKESVTNQLRNLAEALSSKLITAYGSNKHTASILWTQIDSALPSTVYSRFKRDSESALKFTGPLKRSIDGAIVTVITANGKDPDGNNVVNYLRALEVLFDEEFIQCPCTIGLELNSEKTKISSTSATANASVADAMVSTKFYWDYLYYANHFIKSKTTSDGKTKYNLKSEPSGSPCGIVVVYGTTSASEITSAIKEQLKLFDPNGKI